MTLRPADRRRLLSPSANLDFLLRRRTQFLRDHLRPGDRVLEIGAGFGIVDLYVPDVRAVVMDIRVAPWIDAVADAAALPFADGAFDAAVSLAVLHHIPYPRAAMEEMTRVVRPEGLLLIVEPHVSWLLRAVLALTRHEYVDASVDPFGPAPCQTKRGPHEGNNAVGDLLFADMAVFLRAFPQLAVERHRFTECLTFLNSGGVEFLAPRVPLPRAALRWLGALDDWLMRFPKLFPMHYEIVLRKRKVPVSAALTVSA